jgi:hypothetical protein
MEAWTKSLPARSNCANRRFAGTTEPGHFAQTGPELGRLVRAVPAPVHFAPAGPFFGDFARAVSLPAHYGRAGRVGAFASAAEVLGHFLQPEPVDYLQPVPGDYQQPVPGHFPQPVPGHLERTVRARPVPAHLSRPPKLGIA